ncbi:MAG: hypothetical protein P8Y94_05935 [Acidobacteriota bacterium]
MSSEEKNAGVYDVASSTMSYSWAVSLLGMQQAYQMFSGGGEAKTPPQAPGLAPQERLHDLFKSAYEAGDHVQRDMLDTASKYISTRALYDPGTVLQLGSEFIWDMADSFRFFLPESKTFVAWREIRNKIDVYQLVRSVEKKLKLPREGDFNLAEYVDKAYELGPFPALWAVEGLGHDYADAARERGDALTALLQGDQIRNLPAKSLLMLHAGIGLSFAQRPMESLNAKSSDEEVAAVVTEFVRLCRENSQPGYAGAAIESLGLVTRTFHWELVPAVDRALVAFGPETQGYFWHGAGRAAYFLLVNFLPYRDPIWRAVEMGREEAPHDLARQNLMAGTAWAITLVNMRHPEVMATFLEEHGDELWEDRAAFQNGVQSSVIMRFDTSPDDPFVEPFRDFQPPESKTRLVEQWKKLIRMPIDDGLDRVYPVLRDNQKLDEIFRCQPLDTLVAGLAKT